MVSGAFEFQNYLNSISWQNLIHSIFLIAPVLCLSDCFFFSLVSDQFHVWRHNFRPFFMFLHKIKDWPKPKSRVFTVAPVHLFAYIFTFFQFSLWNIFRTFSPVLKSKKTLIESSSSWYLLFYCWRIISSETFGAIMTHKWLNALRESACKWTFQRK